MRAQLYYKTSKEYDNAEADYDADTVFKSLDERVARITLKEDTFCDGYASSHSNVFAILPALKVL